MEEKEYKYDAFISYRHCDLDMFVAENLHKILESYDLPKSVKQKLGITSKTFKRVFRDQEELPLSSNLEDPIVHALNNSKYLIVICSPRLKDSMWCKKEIQTFKKLRGRKNIFCVLIEGEPSDSFPEEVLYDEEKVKTKDGKEKIEKILVEPLAADVRGNTKKEVLNKIKSEKLRLIAPMFGLDYDDLKQRQKIKKQRQIIRVVTIVAVLSILFAIYSLFMFITIQTQQNILSNHQAITLASESISYLKEDNRYNAIKKAYESLTEFSDVNMPYTPEGEYALSEALGLYDVGSSYKSIREFNTDGIVDFIKVSADDKYMAVYDESEVYTLFESKTLRIINKYYTKGSYANNYSFGFLGDSFVYINQDGNIKIVNISDGKEINTIDNDKNILSLRCDSTGKYLTYTTSDTLYIYDYSDNNEIGNIKNKDGFIKNMYYSSDSNYIFVATSPTNFDIYKEDSLTMHVIKTSECKEINNFTLTAGYLVGVITKDDNAYILLNNSVGAKYNAIALSYNYIDGKINWKNNYSDSWSKFIINSYKEGTNDIAITDSRDVIVLNAKNGKEIETFATDSDIINIYSFINSNTYLVFLANGKVNYINMDSKKSIEYKGKYEFNVEKYIDAIHSDTGFILIPENSNRVILYEEKKNNDATEEDLELDYPSSDLVSSLDIDKLKDEYSIKNRNLVDKMIYDTNHERLFVNYKNNDIAIYNVSDKKLINSLDNVGSINHYFGKDKYGRTYIGDVSDSYVLDKDYNKVGHIKGLAKLEDDKVIIRNDKKYYSFKIYTLQDLINIAKEYLGE